MLTQNYKAEYEKASSAVITAVTKSGGNQLRGDVFPSTRTRAWSRTTSSPRSATSRNRSTSAGREGSRSAARSSPTSSTSSLSYEYNRQDRQNRCSSRQSDLPAGLRPVRGQLHQPLPLVALFGKLSTRRRGQLFDLCYNVRHETDIRSFGSQASYDSAENIKNDVATLTGSHPGDREPPVTRPRLTTSTTSGTRRRSTPTRSARTTSASSASAAGTPSRTSSRTAWRCATTSPGSAPTGMAAT